MLLLALLQPLVLLVDVANKKHSSLLLGTIVPTNEQVVFAWAVRLLPTGSPCGRPQIPCNTAQQAEAVSLYHLRKPE